MVMVSILSLGGGGGASEYGVDGYKPPDRVWFLREIGRATGWRFNKFTTTTTTTLPYPRRLESLTVCRCHYKSSNLSGLARVRTHNLANQAIKNDTQFKDPHP